MATKQVAKQKKTLSKNKLIKIQEIYGREKSTATLDSTSQYLKKAGFESLANLLQPSK